MPQVKRLKSEIASANGILFVTPEYNRFACSSCSLWYNWIRAWR